MANLAKARDAKLKGLPNFGMAASYRRGRIFMHKTRIVMPFVAIALVLLWLPQAACAYAPEVNKSLINQGIIEVSYESEKKIMVRIENGSQIHDYALNGEKRFPLQEGNGDYTVRVLEHVEGIKYRQIASETVTVKLDNTYTVYLQSMQMISWHKDLKAVKKARELASDYESDEDKVRAIYNYIVNNIGYDHGLAAKVTSDYLPNIDRTLETRKGICYDYSSLFAAMLRSLGIPTKLVMGTKNDIDKYHAWNQVYIDDLGEWITVDTTYDAGLAGGNTKISMIKSNAEYKVQTHY